MTRPTRRDLQLARRARRHGARSCLRIIWESRRADIDISLGFAICEQESAFKNIFGHDGGGRFPGLKVTKARVTYLVAHYPLGVNGVGFTQLTYPGFVKEAQAYGGAHLVQYQLRVAFRLLHSLVAQHGEAIGIARYNGSGPAATRYSSEVRAKQDRWHHILSGGKS